MTIKKCNLSKIKPINEIIDLKIIKKFNIYYQYFCSYQDILTFNEMKKRAKTSGGN